MLAAIFGVDSLVVVLMSAIMFAFVVAFGTVVARTVWRATERRR